MSIVENALLKAKKGGTPTRSPPGRDSRNHADEGRTRGEDSRAEAEVESRAPAPERREGDRRQQIAAVPAAPVQFPTTAYDPEVCARNRILVPTAKEYARTTAAAAFRMMRTRILQKMRGSDLVSLGVTSPGPSEGKTLSSLNLALSIAQEGNSTVFLLDLDMRKPGMCPSLGIRPTHELSEYFRGEITAPEALFSIGVDNLIVGAGYNAVENSSELLANGRLTELLTYVRGLASNALIIVDLPPVINADDALVAAPLLDLLILVAAEGKTRRDALQRSLDVLSEFKLGGLVLNRSHDSFGSAYYGY